MATTAFDPRALRARYRAEREPAERLMNELVAAIGYEVPEALQPG